MVDISDQAIRAATRDVTLCLQYGLTPRAIAISALNAASPYMSGVKVKDEGKLLMDVTQAIFPEGWTISNRNAVADGIRIVLSAIEPEPSLCDQALDLSVLERLAKIADKYDEPDENGTFPDIQDAMISIRDLRQIRKLLAAIPALKSQPAQTGGGDE